MASSGQQGVPHRFTVGGLVVHHDDEIAVQRLQWRIHHARGSMRCCSARCQRQQDLEHRAPPFAALHGNRVAQDVRAAPHDGQAQAQPLLLPGAGRADAEKLFKDRLAMLLRDARPRIPDLQLAMLAAPPAAHQHTAAARVADGVGKQVADDAFQQRRVPAHHPAARAQAQAQSLFLRLRLRQPGLGRALQQPTQVHVLDVRMHGACVELGDVEQVAEQVLHRRDGGLHLVGEVELRGVGQASAQHADQQADRVHRLAQVMAGGGEETGLGGVGAFGFVFAQ